MPLNDKLVKAVRDLCVSRGVQKRIEQALTRFEFNYVETEGCWVRQGINARIYVAGPNWLFYYFKDGIANPTHSGAGPTEMEHTLRAVCG